MYSICISQLCLVEPSSKLDGCMHCCREMDMSGCSGLTDEALGTLADSIAASRAQDAYAADMEADMQFSSLRLSDALRDARAGSNSKLHIQVSLVPLSS